MAPPPIPQHNSALTAVRVSFSIPSLLGALYIVQHVGRSPSRRHRVFARLMMGMSCMDLFYSIYTIVSPLTREEERSCQAMGFLGQGARLSSVLYNGSLTLYYLITIRYGWKEHNFKRVYFEVGPLFVNFELLMHSVPMVLGWGSAIVPLFLDLYNPTMIGCTISRNMQKPVDQKTLKLQQAALFYGWVWLVFGFIFVAMFLIYRSISSIERRVSSYRMNSALQSRRNLSRDSSSDNVPMDSSLQSFRAGTGIRRRSLNGTRHNTYFQFKRRRAFAVQAMLYCGVFFLTWIWSTIQLYVVVLGFKHEPLTALVYLTAVCETLAGFWNALVYIRPRYLAYRKKQMRRGAEQPQQQQQQEQERHQEEQHGKLFSLRERMEAFVHAASIVVVEEKSADEEAGDDEPSNEDSSADELSSSSDTSPQDEKSNTFVSHTVITGESVRDIERGVVPLDLEIPT